MGVPDMWIKLLKTTPDENWNMWQIWHELSSRRPHEKYIGYAESHDQALVGDKTIMFWLCDAAMYTDMTKFVSSAVIDRGIALHKLIRFVTLTLAGEGYLNFMGNEFGHPEWVDFPREGNGWSYHYCRRQWHLADDPDLKYKFLQAFDRALIAAAEENDIFSHNPSCLFIDEYKQVLVYERGGLIFAVNFSPTNSYESYFLPTGTAGAYRPVFTTDESRFGGWDRISASMTYISGGENKGFPIYLPARTAVCFKKI